jgi:uncharacterized protein
MAGGLLIAYQYFRPAAGGIRGHAFGPEPQPTASKIGRNDPCPCGSGKKYKRCCESATVN